MLIQIGCMFWLFKGSVHTENARHEICRASEMTHTKKARTKNTIHRHQEWRSENELTVNEGEGEAKQIISKRMRNR